MGQSQNSIQLWRFPTNESIESQETVAQKTLLLTHVPITALTPAKSFWLRHIVKVAPNAVAHDV